MNQTMAGKLALIMEKTEIINKNIQFSFMFYLIPVYIITVILNLSVLIMLGKSEKTIVNRLMKLDCMISILYATQSPFFKGIGWDVFCFSHTMLSYGTVVFNRLLPVAIATFRYFRSFILTYENTFTFSIYLQISGCM